MPARNPRTLADRMRQVLSVHRRSNLKSMVVLAIAAAVAVGGLVLLLAAVVKSDPGFRVGAVITGLILLFGAGCLTFLGLHILLTVPSEVRIYPFGIRWKVRNREHEYEWDEVAEVYRSEVIRISRQGRSRDAHVTLVFDDGTRLRCPNMLRNYDKLME